MLALFAAVVLGLVVAHTATTSLVGHIWPRAETARQRITAFGFAAPIAIAAALFLGWHLVFPGLPVTQAVELVHEAWNRTISAEEPPELVLAGGGIGDPPLVDGDTLRFTPDSTSVRGSRVSRWTLDAQTRTVVRVDGEVVNAVGAPVLNSGEALAISWRVGGSIHTVRARLTTEPAPWYGSLIGQARPREVYRLPSGAPLYRRTLQEGIDLASVLTGCEAKACTGAQRLRSVLPPQAVRELDQILLIRRVKGDPTSDLLVLDTRPDSADYRDFTLDLQVSLDGRPALNVLEHERAVASGAVVSIGLGDGLQVRPDSLIRRLDPATAEGRYYVELSRVRPAHYPLPPDWSRDTTGFLVASNADDIADDGFAIGTGLLEEAYYGRLRVVSPDSIRLVGGKEAQARADRFLLGSARQGVTLSIHSRRSEVAVGPLSVPAIAFVFVPLVLWLVHRVGFSLALRSASLPRTSRAWTWTTALWALTLGIVAVRFIAAYRLYAAPPADATVSDLDGVFGKSMSLAVFALGLPLVWTVVGVLTLRTSSSTGWTGRASRWTAHLAERVPSVLFWAAVVIVVAVLGLLPVRSSQLFPIVAAVALALRRHVLVGERREALAAVVALGAALGAVIVLESDIGASVYGLALAALTSFLAAAHYQAPADGAPLLRRLAYPARWAVVVPWVAGAFLVAGPRIPWVAEAFTAYDAQGRGVYRLALLQRSLDQLWLSSDVTAETSILQMTQQSWLTSLMASHGAQSPMGLGYGLAQFRRHGSSYASQFSDNAVVMAVVAEHGWAGALGFLGLLVVLGVALWAGTLRRSPTGASRAAAAPLLFVGGIYVFNSLFQTLGNLNAVVFTGQNVPLLGLHSGTDVLQAGALFAVAAALLALSFRPDEAEHAPNSEPRQDEEEALRNAEPHRVPLRARATIVALVAVATAGLAWSTLVLIDMGQRPELREDHALPQSVLDKLAENLSGDVLQDGSRGPWRLDTESCDIERNTVGTPSDFETRVVDEFNATPLADRFDGDGRVLYFRGQTCSGANLEVNANLFRLGSPFRQANWRGRIEARGEPVPSIAVFGSTLRVGVTADGPDQIVALRGSRATRTSGKVVVLDRFAGDRAFILERVVDPLGVVLRDVDDRLFGVYVNDEPARTDVRLAKGDIIRVSRRGSGDSYTALYLGAERPTLAEYVWRNGRYRYLSPPATQFDLAQTVALTADVARESGQVVPDTVRLSLDDQLHQRLQTVLAEFAEDRGLGGDPLSGQRLAVSVLGMRTAEVLAVPGWPRPGPTPLQDAFAAAGAYEDRFLSNHNFAIHEAGSTPKVFTLAGLATAVHPRFDLGDLVVYRPERSRPIAGRVVVCGVPYDGATQWAEKVRPTVSAFRFIVESDNFYQGTLATLGMAPSLDALDAMLVAAGGDADGAVGGRAFRCDASGLIERRQYPLAPRPGLPPKIRPSELSASILYRSLADNFSIAFADTSGDRLRHDVASRFLPSLASPSRDDYNPYLGFATPTPPVWVVNRFQEPRSHHLSAFLGGGGDVGWSNVHLAESTIRALTGRRVWATFEAVGNPSGLDVVALPPPLDDPAWRARHIADPMEAVHATVAGTATSINSSLVEAAGLRLLVKTGTMTPDGGPRNSGILVFALGRWEDGQFVEEEAIAGALYVERRVGLREVLMNAILPTLIDYVKSLSQAPRAPATAQAAPPFFAVPAS